MADEERDGPDLDGAAAPLEDVVVQGANGAGAAPPPVAGDAGAVADDVVAQLDKAQRELSAMADRHLRLAAEFDNYRKRVAREQAEQHTRSQAELARRVLDALDDLQRVDHFDPAQVTTESLLQALQLVERKFRTALESVGLEEIEAQGAPFNPELMEALMTAPAETPEEDEMVLDVFQKGYRLGHTLVRPAQVRVKKFED
jgi:molecular chaperone GrpE